MIMASSVSVQCSKPTLRQSFEGAQAFSRNFKVVYDPCASSKSKPAEFLRYPSRLDVPLNFSADSEDSVSSRSSYSSDSDSGYPDNMSKSAKPAVVLRQERSFGSNKVDLNATSHGGGLSVKGNSVGEKATESGNVTTSTTLQRSGASSLRASPYSSRTNSTVSSGAQTMNSSRSDLLRVNSSVDSLDGLNLPDGIYLDHAQQLSGQLPAHAPIHRVHYHTNNETGSASPSIPPSRRPTQYGRASFNAGERQNTTATIMGAARILAGSSQYGSSSTTTSTMVGGVGGGSGTGSSGGGGAHAQGGGAAAQRRGSLRPVNREPERLEVAGVDQYDVDQLQLLIDQQCLRTGPNHSKPTMASILGAVGAPKRDQR